MNLVELIRDFIPKLGDLDTEDLEKFDKLAYTLVEFNPVQICFSDTPTEVIYDWFGVDAGSLSKAFKLQDDFESTHDAMIQLGKELGTATAFQLWRREE